MLTAKQRQKVVDKLASEPSDSKLADKLGVSRTTVRRIRQDELVKQTRLKRAASRQKAKEKKMQIVKAPVQIANYPVPKPPDLTPKVDVEPVVMGTYFAVQLLRCEQIRDVANVIMQAAEAHGVLFRKLQVMDVISLGTSSFVRFRSDLVDLAQVLIGLSRFGAGRGFIAFLDGHYRVRFSDGRQGGKFSTTAMCSVQKAGFGNVYAGPKIRRWAQQFQTPERVTSEAVAAAACAGCAR